MFSPRGPSQRQCRHLREGGNPQAVSRTDQTPESSAIRSPKRSWRETAAVAARLLALSIALVAVGSALVAAGSASGATGSALAVTGSTLAAAGSTLAAAGSRMAAAGSRMAAAGSRMTAAGSRMTAPDEVREIVWEELMPPDWNPLAVLDALRGNDPSDLDALPDSSPRAIELFYAYQEAVRSAPVVRELNGQKVRLPGFVVPLDFEGVEISEFLLVPYFGACIHVPPPPSNQIVYVKTVASYPLQGLFDPVWVTGEIRTDAYPNGLGDAGYTLQATIIEPY